MHAPLAVHACTKLGTTAQILQRTCKKSAMRLQKIFVRLTRQTHSPFSEKVSAFLYISTLASNQSCPLVLLDGSDFCNGRLRQIYCKALISHARSCKRKIAHAILEKGLSLSKKRMCLFSETHLRFFTKACPFFLAGAPRFSYRLFTEFTSLYQFCYKSVPNPLHACTASDTCQPPLATPGKK